MEMTSQLLPRKTEEMLKKAARKVVDDKLHSEDVLQELRSKIVSLQLVESDNENFMKLCQILQNSTEHNNIEVFYRNYLKNVVLQNQIYFPNVNKYTSRSLLMKLGDIIKVEVSNIGISITEDSPKSVSESERELAGLQYIGGYIVHKLHNNFRNHKNWRDIELYQATTIIGDCRTTKPCENQKLKVSCQEEGY